MKRRYGILLPVLSVYTCLRKVRSSFFKICAEVCPKLPAHAQIASNIGNRMEVRRTGITILLGSDNSSPQDRATREIIRPLTTVAANNAGCSPAREFRDFRVDRERAPGRSTSWA